MSPLGRSALKKKEVGALPGCALAASVVPTPGALGAATSRALFMCMYE
jgi:hypothetical protein